MNAILPVYKPTALSSFDVIRKFKRKNQPVSYKLGHAGTLDVFAQGVLLLLLGNATKQFDEFLAVKKTYRAGVRLGVSSTTLDVEGVLTSQIDHKKPPVEEILHVCKNFLGKQTQTIPSFSAAKHHGKPLYRLARKGISIEKSKDVEIFEIKLVSYVHPLVCLDITCSSGTYIRQLTADLFSALSLKSFLYSLERTAVGEIAKDQCCTLDDFSDNSWKKFLVSQ